MESGVNRGMKSLLADMTWEEVRDRAKETDVAIIVTGANEQHGLHLPLKTDIFIATEVVKRAVELVIDDVKPVVAPPIPFGFSTEHRSYPGTITIGLETFTNLVEDVLRSLVRSGFHKIVIVNGHGSNPPVLTNAMVEVKEETDAFILVLSWWELAVDEIKRLIETPFLHACEVETSMILGLDFPVDMNKAIGEIPPPPIPGYSYFDLNRLGLINSDFWGVMSTAKTGAIGEPGKGTREKGDRLLTVAGQRLAEVLRSVNEKNLESQFSNPWPRNA